MPPDISGPDGWPIELDFRSVLAPEQPSDERFTYAPWVRALRGKSGVYLIKADPEQFRDELLYIGECHTATARHSLYNTLTRHFHRKGSWKEGVMYSPADVVVAVIETAVDMAIPYQDALIGLNQPRDNQLALELRGFVMQTHEEQEPEQPHEDEEEIPF